MAVQFASLDIFVLLLKYIQNFTPALVSVPSIAQLVERRTVELVKSSLGRWFESGSKDVFFFLGLTIFFFIPLVFP